LFLRTTIHRSVQLEDQVNSRSCIENNLKWSRGVAQETLATAGLLIHCGDGPVGLQCPLVADEAAVAELQELLKLAFGRKGTQIVSAFSE
jgi:hypothetical protein